MSGKIIPAIVAAILLAGTVAASAQSPSAEGAGGVSAYSDFSGYSGNGGYIYNYAPAYNSAPRSGFSDYNPGSSSTR
jgi:hypothetical protein